MQPFGCILWREMDAVFKALADRSRRKLLDRLHQGNGRTLGELCRHLDMTRQAVTKHLGLLEEANLSGNAPLLVPAADQAKPMDKPNRARVLCPTGGLGCE